MFCHIILNFLFQKFGFILQFFPFLLQNMDFLSQILSLFFDQFPDRFIWKCKSLKICTRSDFLVFGEFKYLNLHQQQKE